jgi:dolichyl-phosphate beta-glucosyltransferase
MKCDVIIPCYNEAERLPATLQHLDAYQGEHQLHIIIVDDGSVDDTVDIAQQADIKHSVTIIKVQCNKGKGYALKQGVLSSTAPYVLLYDADAATAIGNIDIFFDEINNGADIAIGNRTLIKNQVEMTWHRRIIGRVYFYITKPLLPKIQDAACGFKLLKGPLAVDLFSTMTINRFAYDVQLLHLAKKAKFTIKEIPVVWNDVAGSKVNIINDGLESLYQIIKLYLRKH